MVPRAIQSFPKGLAGGLDCLRPQHLTDILQIAGNEDSAFLQSLTSFCAMVLEGRVPDAVRPLFWCVTGGPGEVRGVCLIVVGCTVHRLVAKIAGQMVADDIAALVSPRQLGYRVKGGAEATVHAVRTYLQDLPSGHGLLKLEYFQLSLSGQNVGGCSSFSS